MKPKAVLCTTHLGNFGGGENQLMKLSMVLSELTDFYVFRNWPDDFESINGFGKKFRLYNGRFIPDVFIHASQFSKYIPIGRHNVAFTFFPKKELAPIGFDDVMTNGVFTQGWVKKLWGRNSFVLENYVFPERVHIKPKKKKIVNIGHFFEEADGHSKNQHILCQAFTKHLHDLGYELVLIGNADSNNLQYISKVKRFAERKRIKILTNISMDETFSHLADASHYWHAVGYGQTNPAHTEHWGLSIVEAIAHGCTPIVHNSGGAAQIVEEAGGFTWKEPTELENLTLSGVHGKIKLDPKYDGPKYFEERVREWLAGLSL